MAIMGCPSGVCPSHWSGIGTLLTLGNCGDQHSIDGTPSCWRLYSSSAWPRPCANRSSKKPDPRYRPSQCAAQSILPCFEAGRSWTHAPPKGGTITHVCSVSWPVQSIRKAPSWDCTLICWNERMPSWPRGLGVQSYPRQSQGNGKPTR
jgi:hypothetical protein